MTLKEQTILTASNLYITRDLEGNITSVYFLPLPNAKKGIEDIKFKIIKNKLTISAIIKE